MQIGHIPDTWTITEDKYKRIYVYDETGQQRCGAPRRSDGKPCRNIPKQKKNNVRCTQQHSGNAAKGIQSATFKHGNSSKYKDLFPQQLSQRYQDSLNDIDLLDISKRVAILDVRLKQLIEQTDDGDYGTLYSQIMKRAYETSALLESYKRNKKEIIFIEFEEQFEDLFLLIQSGQTQYQTWQEIKSVIGDIKSLIKTESDIEYQGEKAVTIRELGDFMFLLKGVLLRADLSQEQLKDISEGITTIWNYDVKEIEND